MFQSNIYPISTRTTIILLLYAKYRADFCKVEPRFHISNGRYILTKLCSLLYELLRILRCCLVKSSKNENAKETHQKARNFNAWNKVTIISYNIQHMLLCKKIPLFMILHNRNKFNRTHTFTKLRNNLLDLKRLNQRGKYSNQIQISYSPNRSMLCFYKQTT